jgi:hypothetical protein
VLVPISVPFYSSVKPVLCCPIPLVLLSLYSLVRIWSLARSVCDVCWGFEWVGIELRVVDSVVIGKGFIWCW